MTESSVPPEVRRACATISWRAGLDLEPTPFSIAGGRDWALRPADNDDSRSLSLVLSSSPVFAAATVLPDTFAGRLVRSFGHQAIEFKHEWTEIFSDAQDAEVQIVFDINGHSSSPAEFSHEIWESFELWAQVRIKRPITSENLADAWVKVGLRLLSLLLVGGDLDNVEEEELEGLPEGERRERQSRGYERSRANRIRCIEHHGCACYVCDFDFQQFYGQQGDGFIEVHHKIPLATVPPGYRPNPKTEMVPLCSNCHSIVHRVEQGQLPIDPDQLRQNLALDGQP